MKDKDPDIVFAWCALLSVVVSSCLAFVLTLHFFPVSTGIKSDALSIVFQLTILAVLVSLMAYVSDNIIPNPRRRS